MAYRALYRTYRPTRFSDVIGQEHITTTLKNQVQGGHIAHAYLFCGSRGTGKTTSARILARAVNCLDPEAGEPCGKCEACLAAADENNGDIIEIDAASNNGVDDVRALIEKAQFAPLHLSRRVFIIDEVHMLSGAAFNALLKTLEEPPAHILFILATTEPQKLPATIISRCQRFDFHRLSVADIKSTLESVLQKAGASIDEEGLLLIARAADGGMRDALSLCDQCLAFCGNTVAARDVYDVLGSMDEGFLFDMAGALLAGDAGTALHMLGDIVVNGRDLTVFCQDLAGHFRALLLAKTCGRCTELLDCTDDAMTRYLQQAESASQARLLLANEHLLRAQADMRYLATPRAMLESTLVRICRPEQEQSLAALEARVDRLESGVSMIHPAAEAQPVATIRPASLSPQSAQAAAPFETDAPPLPEPPPESEPPLPPALPPEPKRPAEAPRPQAARKQPTPAPAAQPEPAAAPVGDGSADALWDAVLAGIQGQNIMVHMMARSGIAQRMEDDTLVVGFSDADEAQFNSVNAPINQNRLQGILSELRPGTRLSLVKIKVAPASDETTEKARALFGDKLVIE